MQNDNSLITVFIIFVFLRIIFYQIQVMSFNKIIFYMKGFVEIGEPFLRSYFDLSSFDLVRSASTFG